MIARTRCGSGDVCGPVNTRAPAVYVQVGSTTLTTTTAATSNASRSSRSPSRLLYANVCFGGVTIRTAGKHFVTVMLVFCVCVFVRVAAAATIKRITTFTTLFPNEYNHSSGGQNVATAYSHTHTHIYEPSTKHRRAFATASDGPTGRTGQKRDSHGQLISIRVNIAIRVRCICYLLIHEHERAIRRVLYNIGPAAMRRGTNDFWLGFVLLDLFFSRSVYERRVYGFILSTQTPRTRILHAWAATYRFARYDLCFHSPVSSHFVRVCAGVVRRMLYGTHVIVRLTKGLYEIGQYDPEWRK